MRTFTLYILITVIGSLISVRTLRAQPPAISQSNYNVLNYGAKGDGKTKDTMALRKAIDTCNRNGGGTVYFPPGNYLTGSLRLRSDVALYLDHGAAIIASTNDEDFDPYEDLGFDNDADTETSFFHHSVIWGEDVENVAITGTGTIDANREKSGDLKGIALKRCKYVTIRDVTVTRTPSYAISMLGTDYVNIDGVKVIDTLEDAIVPDCCQNVRISNCFIESGDDCIVPKSSFSLGYRRSTENITVTNCIMATRKRAFKLGTESSGGFKYITLSNCVMFKSPKMGPRISGIEILSVDGADIDGVTITNISMTGVRGAPIFLRLGNRGRDMKTPTPGTLKNVVISNVIATDALRTCAIVGIPRALHAGCSKYR